MPSLLATTRSRARQEQRSTDERFCISCAPHVEIFPDDSSRFLSCRCPWARISFHHAHYHASFTVSFSTQLARRGKNFFFLDCTFFMELTAFLSARTFLVTPQRNQPSDLPDGTAERRDLFSIGEGK